jgi:cation diffusion facilitator family transporter
LRLSPLLVCPLLVTGMPAVESKFFIYISLIVDILIAVSKFIAAAFTGSSAMISEGIHSIIDAISQLMLIWGIKISKKRPDEQRPFGYGRELYFWSFIVSLVIFLLGGCISFYEGLTHLQHPQQEGNEAWNYAILGIAFLFTAVSMFSALKAFNKQRGDKPFFKAVIESKDPSTFIVLLGDVGDMMGLIVAFGGVLLEHVFHEPKYDGIASMVIGVILLLISALLVRESKSLLMGETTSRKTLRRIIRLTEADEAIIKVKKHFSMYLAPEEIVLQLIAVFKPDLNTQQLTEAIERVTKIIKKEFPKIKQIFIEPVAR